MSIFSHALIVMSGTSLVPYGFTVLNGCLVIAALQLCLHAQLCLMWNSVAPFYTFLESFSLWVEVIVASFC